MMEASRILVPAIASAVGLTAVLLLHLPELTLPTWSSQQTSTSSGSPLPWGTGSWTEDGTTPCQFSYPRFHVYFTLPATAILYFLNRPFLTQLDKAKLVLLPCIAFVWTTPWDNELVRQRAWRYPRSCVIGTIGYVPYEEYFFFIIQSVMTTLFVNFTSRWLLPTLYIFQSPSERGRKAFTPSNLSLVACSATFVAGCILTRPQQHSYYLGMILWWASIPLGLLFWGTSAFVARMPWRGGKTVFLFSLLLPTFYLWACDLFALKRGTWHINEATSFNVFPIPELPIEEMIFFLLTNLLLVIASLTFDRCIALGRLQIGTKITSSSHLTPYSPSHLPLSWTTIKSLWMTFVTQDPEPLESARGNHSTPQAHIADLKASFRILSRASKSFSLASYLFPWDLRSDLSILYGFCRAADDFVDDEVADSQHRNQVKEHRLALLHEIVDAIYSNAETDVVGEAARLEVLKVLGSYTEGQDQGGSSTKPTLPTPLEDLRASAFGVVSLRSPVPKSLWLELLRGYKRDLQLDLYGYEARFKTMEDLIDYAQCVAGCVGEMCVRVVLARCGRVSVLNDKNSPDEDKITLEKLPNGQWTSAPEAEQSSGKQGSEAESDRLKKLIFNARRMGVALQLVNIARDVVDDSIKLKRCYLPEDLLQNDVTLQRLFSGSINTSTTSTDTSSKHITPESLRPVILNLLMLSKELHKTSYPWINYFSTISKPVQSGFKVACQVYFEISFEILHQSQKDINQGKRATLSNARRIWIAVKCVFF
ncbi:unnamed protein product [Sympodiomycopsis kandeliae]